MQLFAFVSGSAWAVGGGSAWWRSYDGAQDAFLAPIEVAAAQLCQRFAPLAQQVELLAERTGIARADATKLFAQLQQRGLVVSSDAIAPLAVAELPRIVDPLIAVRTYRRPDSLRRVLASLLVDERRYGVKRRVVVIDDADDAVDADVSQAAVDAIRRDGLNVGYFGPMLRERSVHDLGLDRSDHPLRSMLTPAAGRTAAGGRTWNWSLLLAAGGSLSYVDDDCEFPVRVPEQVYRNWSLQESLANEGRFFDDGLPELPIAPEDPYATMARVVGQPVGVLWHRDGVATNHFAGKTTAQFGAWATQRRVLAASTGIYGGHVYNSAAYFSVTDAASRADLLRSPFRIERLDGNCLWQGVTAARLTRHAVYSPMLLDARELLPFTTALGKGDDTAFFGLLTGMEPTAAFAQLPLLMGHFPVEDRQRRERALQELFLDSNHYIGFFAERASQGLLGRDRAARLQAICALANDSLATDDREFRADIQMWRGRKIADLLAGLHESRVQAGDQAPAQWRTFIGGIEQANRAAMAQPIPGERLAQYRRVLSQVAAAGPLWPEVWARMQSGFAAELLGESGLRPL